MRMAAAEAARILVLLLALLVAGGPAAAQAPDPLSEAYEAGMRAYHAHDPEGAARHFERALAIARERYGGGDPRLATDLNNLAEAYRLLGRFAEAEQLYLEALELDRRRAVANPSETATTLNNLALLYRAQHRFDEAEALYRQALALLEQEVGPHHPDIARLLNNWALLKLAQNEPEAALELERRALEVARRGLEPEHPSLRVLENNMERIRSALASGSGTSPAPTAEPSAAAVTGRFAVHLASMGSQQAALEAAARLRSRHDFLAGIGTLPPQQITIEGRGTFWRVLFGPFASHREAAELCARAKARGTDCFVRELGG